MDVVVYTPKPVLRHPLQLLAEMLHDLVSSNELARQMFVRDLKASYRQSFLGYLWILLPPLASTFMFGFLQRQSILTVAHTDIPYPAFVLMGTMFWEAFSTAIGTPLTVVSGASSMLTKLNFPREALLLTALYQVLFNLSLKLLLLAPVCIYFGTPLHVSSLLGVVGIVPLVLLGFAFGLLVLPMGMLYQDVNRGLTIVLSAWFLVTPVIYPPPTKWPGTLLNELNPVSPLLITARQLFTGAPLTHLLSAVLITVAALVMLLVAWIVYRLAMPHLVARMSA